MMGRKTAHFKPYWAFIGTGSKRKRKSMAVTHSVYPEVDIPIGQTIAGIFMASLAVLLLAGIINLMRM